MRTEPELRHGWSRAARASIAAALTLGVAVTAACSTSDTAIPVIVDSDGAFDDMKAILFLLEQPDVEILAITMSGTGVARCPHAAENAAAVLERIDAPDIPVACGSSTPTVGSNEAPAPWRDAADSMGGVALPDPRPLSDLSAPELLIDTVAAADDDVTIVALGPLTNLAEAIELDASFIDAVERIYLMGGAVDAGGNVMYANPRAEFNIWADAHAAQAVFDTEVPITLVPLDATNAVPVTPRFYDVVAAHHDDSVTSEFMHEYLEANPLTGGWYHWDELAAVAATDDAVVELEERWLVVVTGGGATAGATIETPNGRPVDVAVSADRDRFEARFFEAIIGTDDPDVAEWEADATITADGDECTYAGPEQLPTEFAMQIDNDGPDVLAIVTGSYAPGTTTDDIEAYRAAGAGGTPDWWIEGATVVVPSGARDVWILEGGDDITVVCFLDEARFGEVAGPQLLE